MCVLSLVAHQDQYGYELVQAISNHLPISEGTIYPILRRLTQEKYFETYLIESSEGPPRKYYRMTALGHTFTQGLIRDWNQFKDNVDQILQKKSPASHDQIRREHEQQI